jgi:alkyl hydroperoxide reductase subunit F
MYDLMIIGAGPAGLAASVYAARKQLKTILVSHDIGGQLNWNARVENYLGYQFIEGWELVSKFQAQVKQYPIEQNIGQKIIRIIRTNNMFTALSEVNEEFQAKAVVFTTGKRSKLLSVPGEKEFTGRGVSYCAVCDGPVFAGKKVAVIGGGNSALEAALDMVHIAEHVYLISLTQLTADNILINRLMEAKNVTVYTEYSVEKINGEQFVSNIAIKNVKNGQSLVLDVSGVFVEIGMIPNSDPVKELLPLNERGEIYINCSGETSIAGFFAAGDVTSAPEKQIVVAAGDGAKAALRAHRYLQRLAD